MNDLELVNDAHAFANRLAKTIADEKSGVMDDGADGGAWAVTMLTELARVLAISFVAATDNPQMYSLFMNHVAESAATFVNEPRIIAESLAKARQTAAKIDASPRALQ